MGIRGTRRLSKEEKDEHERNLAIASCVFGITALIAVIAVYLVKPDSSETCDLHAVSGLEKRFAISATVGSLTFAQARAIDVAWDFGVGQGGRAVLAWMLYKQISWWIVDFIDAHQVSYSFFVATMLSTNSWESFWHLLKCAKRQKLDLACRCKVILLVWSTAHVLLFPTLWSAATGYINPSQWNYQMPDNNLLVDTDSSQLRFCWNCTDCSRLGIQNDTTMYSSPFSQLNPSFGNYTSYLQRWDAGSYRGIDRQAFATQGIYMTVQRNDKSNIGSFFNYTSSVEYLLASVANFLSDYNIAWRNTTFPENYTQPLNATAGSEFYLTNNASVSTQDIEWIYNDSIPRVPGIIPYSSSIQIDDITHQLAAPILSFAVPTMNNGHRSPLTPSVCYNNTPLPSDWLDPASEHLICVAAPNFVWGFSPFLAGMGLIFQIVWFAALAVNLRFWKAKKKEKRSSGRSGTLDGTYRSIVTLARAIEEALGGRLLEYNNKEIKKALEECGKLGWIRTTKHSKQHFALSSGPYIKEFSSSTSSIAEAASVSPPPSSSRHVARTSGISVTLTQPSSSSSQQRDSMNLDPASVELLER